MIRKIRVGLFSLLVAGMTQAQTSDYRVFTNDAAHRVATNSETILDTLTLNSATQHISRIVLNGQEYYQAGVTSTDGVALVLGANRAGNRQLWIVDSTQVATPSSTNAALRFVLGSVAHISAVATDGNTPKPLLLNIDGGNVGIGTASPSQALEVNGNIRLTAETGSVNVGAGPANSGFKFLAKTTSATVPAAIWLESNYASNSTSFIGNFGTYGTYLSQNRNPQTGEFVHAAAPPNQVWAAQAIVGDTQRNRLFHVANYPSGSESVHFIINYSGNVGIGAGALALMSANPTKRLVVDGDIHVSGNINAKYQDLAEWVPASEDLTPGTVVVLNPAHDNEVMASTRAYDTAVAGVVSEKPGLLLGEEAKSSEAIATTGRVRVRVDARRAPIAVGDLLVTSDVPGVAMKSMPVDVAGVAMHRPGTIVGKALQPLREGEGESLVLLSLQ